MPPNRLAEIGSIAPAPKGAADEGSAGHAGPDGESLEGDQREEIMKKVILAEALLAGFSVNAFAAGGKPAVGVAEFKIESAAGWWNSGVGWELSGMLSNELQSSGHFRIVE